MDELAEAAKQNAVTAAGTGVEFMKSVEDALVRLDGNVRASTDMVKNLAESIDTDTTNGGGL